MVVLCASSAINYIEDIRNAEYARLKGEIPAIYVAKESYEDTLAMVREINPCVILPGTDYALELATNGQSQPASHFYGDNFMTMERIIFVESAVVRLKTGEFNCEFPRFNQLMNSNEI